MDMNKLYCNDQMAVIELVNELRCWSGVIEERFEKIDARLAALEDRVTGLSTNLIMRDEQAEIFQAGVREGKRMAALERPAIDGAGDGWIKMPNPDEIVWAWQVSGNGASKIKFVYIEPGDLWQPYDPAHPEPPQKPVGGE